MPWAVCITVLSGGIDQNDTTNADDVVADTASIAGANACHVLIGNGTAPLVDMRA